MSRALYRKYRSTSLDEIVGQDHVTTVLKKSLAQGRVAHAYLLTGPPGVGKTSIARILAYEINKLPYDESASNLDVIEIDAASNNGVEDVRDLREKVQIAPVAASKKIYIIDEVHMLSKAAFNALLKTLEEPPEHTVFILATTDVDKLPATIISRTQQFRFRAISPSDAKKHLRTIADAEKIMIDDDALAVIAERGNGSFRDSISLLDQLATIADDKQPITTKLIEQALGLASQATVEQLLIAYETKDLQAIVALLDASEQSGTQAGVLTAQLIRTIKKSLASKPQLIVLLDQLLDVAKSSQPAIKLLTVLAAHAVPKPKVAALTIPTLEVSAPLAELERQAIKKKPAMPTSDASSHSHVSVYQPDEQVVTTSVRAHVEKSERATTNIPTNLAAFDWPELVEYTRQHFIAIHSVLSKCHHELNGETLVLYTMNAFYKKKLDDAKYSANLAIALQKTGVGNIEIVTIGTPPPPKDETAAAVAAIMGGGEEVQL